MVSLKNFATTRKAVRLFLRGSGCYYLSWLLLLVSPFLFTARTAKEVLDGTLNTANLLRLSVLTIACILLFNKTLIIKTIIKRNSITVYFLFSMFAIGSALWSVALTPTLGKSGELFLGTFLVFLVVNNENCKLAYRILNKILETTLLILTLVLQLMVVGFFVAPSTFAAPSTGFFQWRLGMENVFISANGVAYLGAILAANALGNIVYPSDKGKFRKKKWYLSIYCLGWLSIILAQGRTGAAALLIVSILILFQKRNTLILLLITALPVSFISSRMVEQFFVRNESIELLTSLTGRTILWEHAWFAFLEKPLFGYGFGVASRFVFSLGISGFSETISSIHNAYIELLISVGLVGFLIFLLAMCVSLRLAINSFLTKQNVGISAIIFSIFLITPMTSGLTASWGFTYAIFLVATAILDLKIETLTVNRNKLYQFTNSNQLRDKNVASFTNNNIKPAIMGKRSNRPCIMVFARFGSGNKTS